MNNIYVEFCQGHSLKGVQDSYFLPQPDNNGVYLDILEGHDKSPGYLDAIDYLTIDNSKRLQRENEMLKVKKSEIEQLKEKAEAHEAYMARLEPLAREIQELKEKLGL